MTSSRPLTQDERREASRRAIIDAAIKVLAEEGYRRMTFVRIQELAGISRGLINYYFSSKANLVSEVIRSVRDTYASEATGRLRDNRSTGLDAVLEIVNSYLVRLAGNPHPATVMLVLAMTVDAGEPEVRDAVQLRFAEMRDELRGWIEAGISDGTLRDDLDAGACAGVVEGILRGVALQYSVDRKEFDLDSTRVAALSLVRAALAVPR